VVAASAFVDGHDSALAQDAHSADTTSNSVSGSRGSDVMVPSDGEGEEFVGRQTDTSAEGRLHEAEAPAAMISRLRGFQKQGLGWMQAREAMGMEAVGVGAGLQASSEGGNVSQQQGGNVSRHQGGNVSRQAPPSSHCGSMQCENARADEGMAGGGGAGLGVRDGVGCVDVATQVAAVDPGQLHPLWSEWHVPVYNCSNVSAHTNASSAGFSEHSSTVIKRVFLKAIEGELRLEKPAACRPVRGGILAGRPLPLWRYDRLLLPPPWRSCPAVNCFCICRVACAGTSVCLVANRRGWRYGW
jgi:hypothetical protein